MKRGKTPARPIRRRTAQLGEVVVAAFDKAAHYGTNPEHVSRLALRAIALMLRPQRGQLTASRWPSLLGDPS